MKGDAWLDPARRVTGATRLVSFNIRNGRALDVRRCWWRRRNAVLETLHRLDPDLVGLQEAFGFQANWLCRRLPGYGSYGVGRKDGARRGEQALVLYKQDRYRLLRAETRWYGHDPWVAGSKLPGAQFPRTATIVELEHRHDGTVLGFINTHLDAHEQSNRRKSAAQLATWVKSSATPTVVVGDLNEGPDGPAVTLLREMAQLRQSIPADAGGSNHDFTGRSDGLLLDHILVPLPWRVLASGVDRRRVAGRLASDHWPVVADVVPGPLP